MPMLKSILGMAFFWVLGLTLSAQDRYRVNLLAHFNDTALTRSGTLTWNDVMGWHDIRNGNEYLISGTSDSIYIFAINQTPQLKLCARWFGSNRNCKNRDFYVYQQYLYAVSDQCDEVGKLQIFDLSYLPDSVVKVHESDSLGGLTHTIFIEEKSARMYMALNKTPDSLSGQLIRSPMDIISLANPIAPVKIGTLRFPAPYESARVHEAYVRNDTAYCSSENAGLFIFDLTQPDTSVLLGAIVPPYPANAYNHSCWLDSSGRYLLFCDETPEGVGMKIYDLIDIKYPRLIGQPFKWIGSPHNSYWKGDLAYTSMYYGGMQIYSLRNLNEPVISGYYDTYPDEYTGTYQGCWGVWPFLPSGKILASDMQYGVFVFDAQMTSSLTETHSPPKLIVRPNPAHNFTTFQLPETTFDANLSIYDLTGKLAYSKNAIHGAIGDEYTIHFTLQKGIYVVKFTSSNYSYITRIVIQ